MEIIKKDGRIEPFNLDKIKTTLERASDDSQEPFTISDVKLIANTIEKKIFELNLDKVESSQIREIVIEQLDKEGFNDIAVYYSQGKQASER